MKRRFDHERPACAILIDSGTDLELRSSSSLSVPSTCSRRVLMTVRAVRAGADGPLRTTVSLRFSAFRSPDRIGYRNTQATPPIPRPRRERKRHVRHDIASGPLAYGFGRVERGGKALLFAVVARPVPEAGAADAGRAVVADDVALRVFPGHVVDEDILGDDDVALHPEDFGDVGNASRSVAQARGLHDDVDGARTAISRMVREGSA